MRGKQLNRDILALSKPLVANIEGRLQRGEHVPDCLAKTLILNREQEGLDWEDMCMLIAVFVLGGVHSVRRS